MCPQAAPSRHMSPRESRASVHGVGSWGVPGPNLGCVWGEDAPHGPWGGRQPQSKGVPAHMLLPGSSQRPTGVVPLCPPSRRTHDLSTFPEHISRIPRYRLGRILPWLPMTEISASPPHPEVPPPCPVALAPRSCGHPGIATCPGTLLAPHFGDKGTGGCSITPQTCPAPPKQGVPPTQTPRHIPQAGKRKRERQSLGPAPGTWHCRAPRAGSTCGAALGAGGRFGVLGGTVVLGRGWDGTCASWGGYCARGGCDG